MADDTSTKDGNDGGTTSTAEGFTPITSQEELDRRIGARLDRERGKFSDYDELKVKASRFDELEQAKKSEVERAEDKAAEAERERDTALADAMRWKVAAKHGVSDEDAELFLTANDEETLIRQAERLAGRASTAPRVPREGTNTTSPKPDETREFARSLFGRGT